MHTILLEISDVIEQASADLLREYDPERLYALRVSARRTRSILKHIGDHRSRRFRKSWGGFTATTNESRDWDVFLATAEQLLSGDDFTDFSNLNQERVQSCHEAVIEMLRSAPWRRHLEEWRICLERADEDNSDMAQDNDALDRALTKACLVLERALAVDDDRSWHKFRIAVKEVRYVADAGKDDPQRALYLAGVVETCKVLQTLLGDWHDTVVQLNMLEELEAAPVHDRLATVIKQRKQQFLAEIRDMVAGHPLFSQDPINFT